MSNLKEQQTCSVIDVEKLAESAGLIKHSAEHYWVTNKINDTNLTRFAEAYYKAKCEQSEAVVCQYGIDIGMPEHSCAGACLYQTAEIVELTATIERLKERETRLLEGFKNYHPLEGNVDIYVNRLIKEIEAENE